MRACKSPDLNHHGMIRNFIHTQDNKEENKYHELNSYTKLGPVEVDPYAPKISCMQISIEFFCVMALCYGDSLSRDGIDA